jgi:signal transduction histidine kinase
MKLKKLNLNAIVYLSFGTILTFVAIIVVITLLELSKMWQYSHHLYSHVFLVNKSLRDIQVNIYAINNIYTLPRTTSTQKLRNVEKDEKEIEKSFLFLYQNYTGPKSNIDSANFAYNNLKFQIQNLNSFTGSPKGRISKEREIDNWLQVMSNYNFNTVDFFFTKAQRERSAMKRVLAIAIILTFCSSGIVIYLFVLKIKKPIQELTRVTQQFSKGNYNVRSNFKSDNELGVLSDSFNILASSVDLQYHQLIEQSKTLELQKSELLEKYTELAMEKEKAESADRLKTAFLLNMSHELRTPLNSIIGFSAILLQRLPGPLNDEQIKQLKMIQLSGRHLLSLINDILDISKIEAGEIKPFIEGFDINEVIVTIVDQFMPAIREKGLILSYTNKLKDGMIESDKMRLAQVLINLVNNAVKFTSKGFVRITCCRDNDNLYIDISDSGIGIKEEDISNLFTPFLQLENNLTRNYEGSGLGLSISRKLIEMLHGSIRIQSTYKVGSTFTVILPLRTKTENHL